MSELYSEIRFDEHIFVKTKEFSDIGFWELDLKSGVLNWSLQVYQIYGVSPDRSLGDEENFEFYEDQERKRLELIIKNSISAKKPFVGEFSFHNTAGEEKWIQHYGEPCSDKSGEVVRVIGTIQEISLQKKKELEEQKDQAISLQQSKLRSISELTAGIGHEINNPLSVIWSLIDTLKEKSGDDESFHDLFVKVEHALQRIKAITEGLRQFSKIDENLKELFRVGTAVDDSILLLRDSYEKEGIEIVVDNQIAGEIRIKGAQGRFQQVIMSLLENAKDALMPVNDRKIEVKLTRDKDILSLIVSDNGIGIPEEIKPKIFDSFFSSKKVGEGTGLGLSTARSIIEELEGSLTVKSEINRGSSFVISLPVREGQVDDIKDNSSGEGLALKLQECRIMLVDDEEGILDILTDILSDICKDVRGFTRAEEAYLEYCDNPDKYDLIISDVKMPGWSGLTFLKVLRENHEVKQPKFLFITAGANVNLDKGSSDIQEEYEGCLYKPFNKSDIINMLEKIYS